MTGVPKEVLDTFDHLCAEALRAAEATPSVHDWEPYFVAVLQTIKAHPDGRAFFAARFQGMVAEPAHRCHELLAFCMHELKWPEVAEAAEATRRRFENRPDRTSIVAKRMRMILRAYTESWSGPGYYAYYGADDSD